MQRNDFVTVTIEDMGVNGEGIGKVDGYPLFIKDAVIGDVVEAKVVKAKKNYGYARVMNVLSASQFRVDPKCPLARQCGGCQIQALAYDKQLEFKEKKIRDNLVRIGEVPPELLDRIMEPIVGMETPYHYRNKAQFPVGVDKEGHVVSGFYAGRTHQIIPHTDCALGVPINAQVMKCVLDFMERFHIAPYDEAKHKGLVRHVLVRYGFTTKEVMVCIVVNGTKIPHVDVLVKCLREIEGMASITLCANQKRTNVIMGDEVSLLWGQPYITDYIGDIKYRISPLSFYQVNPVQTQKLYDLALAYADLSGNEIVWDMYCGIGTISLFLAKEAKQVYGVEMAPQAVADAKLNAEINGIENVEFFMGKTEEVLPEYFEKYANEHPGETAHADVVVVDPPRKGCEESVLRTIVDMGAWKVVYVSCDPATLARDVKYLRGRGYEIERVRGVDMFGMTVHVEVVIMMTYCGSDKKSRG